ncbi:MAG: hypothetical protein QXX08_01090 [Candidatus Bathyarchaeia archaeon]
MGKHKQKILEFISERIRLNIASLNFLLVMLLSLMIYLLTKGPHVAQNHFVFLAEAFLKGKLGILSSSTGLSELVPYQGNYYVVYPPMPAVLLLPFVAVFGTSFDQGVLSIIIGSLAVGTTWLMLKKIGVNGNKAFWLTALFGFGTCFWFITVIGSSWYIAHVSAVFFLTCAIIEALGNKRNFLIGFLLGCSYLSRLPTVLSLPFFLLLIYDENKEWNVRLKKVFSLFLGLVIPAGLNALYNYARYGTFFDVGYFMIPGVLEEPWYSRGIFHWSYIPRHIYAIFFQGPILLYEPPYFKPNWMGLGLFFTTPAFLYIFKGSWNKLSKFAGIAVLSILPPIVTHGTVGFTQFGYRFSLDFTPFLIMLTAKGMREKLGWSEKSLIILSMLINLWGVISIVKFGFVGYN